MISCSNRMILMVVATRMRCSRCGFIDQVYAAPHSCQPGIAINAWPRETLPLLVDQEEVIIIHILIYTYIYIFAHSFLYSRSNLIYIYKYIYIYIYIIPPSFIHIFIIIFFLHIFITEKLFIIFRSLPAPPHTYINILSELYIHSYFTNLSCTLEVHSGHVLLLSERMPGQSHCRVRG